MFVEKIPERFREDRTRVNWIEAFFLQEFAIDSKKFRSACATLQQQKIKFIAHKELLMFQNKTSCRLTTTSHASRDDDAGWSEADDVMKASKSIFPESQPSTPKKKGMRNRY